MLLLAKIILLRRERMAIKMMHHVCIQTSNYRESLKFYTEILGFEIVKETKNFMIGTIIHG